MPQSTEPTARNETSAAWAILPLGLATALSLMGDSTLYTVLPTHPTDAGIALGAVGLILSVNRFIRLLTNGPAGWLVDHLPNRRLLFLGSLALGVLSTTIYALSSGLAPLLMARLLWGLAWSGIWIGGNAIVLQMAPELQRGHWVGIYQVWFFLGAATGTFLGGALTDAVGYREALWIGAAISAFGALAAVVALPRRQTPSRQERTIRALRQSWRVSLGRSLRDVSPAMWAAATAQGVNRLATSGIIVSTMGLVVQQNVGAEWQLGSLQVGVASITGILLTARTFVSLVGAPIAGTMSDRTGQRWGWLAQSLVVCALGVGVLPAPSSITLIMGTFLSAIAAGSIQSLATALVGDLSTAHQHGKNLGIFYTAGDLGSAIGPLAAYALLPITGLPAVYLGCMIVMLGVAAWTLRFAAATQGSEKKSHCA